ERAKIFLLKEAIGPGRAQNNKGLSVAERESESTITSKLVSLNIQLEREEEKGKPPAVLSSRRNQRRAAQTDYQALIRKLYAAHPELKVNRAELTPIGFDEAGTLLSNDTNALIEFAVTGPNTYLFAVTTGKAANTGKAARGNSSLVLKAYPLNISGRDLSERVRNFNQSLASREDSHELARELYDLLLKPAAEQLDGKTSF